MKGLPAVRVGTLMLAVVIIGMFTGCASFRGNKLPEIGRLPSPSSDGPKPTLAYQATFAQTGGQDLAPAYEPVLEAVLRESDYFQSVVRGKQTRDINMNLSLQWYVAPAAAVAGAISGATWTTIPGWATREWTVEAEVTRFDGMKRNYHLYDTHKLVLWFPMILVGPFGHGEAEVSQKVVQNMFRNLLVRIKDDGFLEPPKVSP